MRQSNIENHDMLRNNITIDQNNAQELNKIDKQVHSITVKVVFVTKRFDYIQIVIQSNIDYFENGGNKKKFIFC